MNYVTIEGFEKLSQQQIFDISVGHILNTRKKSLEISRHRCVYSGSGCAAAPFIRPDMREFCDNQAGAGSGWWELMGSGLVPSGNERLISDLQSAHDGAYEKQFMPNFKKVARRIAERYKLSTRLIDEDDKREYGKD